MSDLTPETLAELRRLLADATAGPWEVGNRQHIASVMEHKFGPGRCCYCDTKGEPTFVRGCIHVHEDDERWWDHGIYAYRPGGSICVVNDPDEYGYMTRADSALIVAAVNALPALLDELEEARAKLDTVRGVVDCHVPARDGSIYMDARELLAILDGTDES